MKTSRINSTGKSLVCLFLVLFSYSVFAQQETFQANEIALGLGVVHSFERDLFNVTSDFGIGASTGFLLSFLHNFDEQLAIGIHVFGYFKTTPEFTVVSSSGGVQRTTFDVTASNVGVQGRWVFTRGEVQPYVYAMMNYSTGDAESDLIGRLGYRGITSGGGGGAGIILSENVKISLEGILSLGTAKWSQRPFSNSRGDEFNPSLIGILAVISYIWS